MGADSGPLNHEAAAGGDEPRPDVADLAAFVEGYWTAWHGLDPLPTTAEVADQLGSTPDEPPHSGVLGGSPTMFRRYRPDVDGPEVIVWFEGEIAVAVQLDQLGQSPLDGSLGEPEAVFDSAFGNDWEQQVFGGRGLVIHVRRGAADRSGVALAFGLAPFHSSEFGDDPIRFEGGTRRRPRR